MFGIPSPTQPTWLTWFLFVSPHSCLILLLQCCTVKINVTFLENIIWPVHTLKNTESLLFCLIVWILMDQNERSPLQECTVSVIGGIMKRSIANLMLGFLSPPGTLDLNKHKMINLTSKLWMICLQCFVLVSLLTTDPLWDKHLVPFC